MEGDPPKTFVMVPISALADKSDFDMMHAARRSRSRSAGLRIAEVSTIAGTVLRLASSLILSRSSKPVISGIFKSNSRTSGGSFSSYIQHVPVLASRTSKKAAREQLATRCRFTSAGRNLSQFAPSM